MKNEKAMEYVMNIIDHWLPYKIKADNIPGISVGIVYRGKLIYNEGYGFANINKKIKADALTQYPIASISKVITSFAIQKLAEEKKIKLSDPVNKYLPWFSIKSLHSDLVKITIQDLLTHTSGVWRDGNTYHWYDDAFPTDVEIEKNISKDLLKSKKGTFKYSNYWVCITGTNH